MAAGKTAISLQAGETMKRRDFLGALAAGATLASLPVSAITTPDPIIWNAETLAASLESMFTCSVGPPTAFYEVLASTGKIIPPEQKLEDGVQINRYVYESYVCCIEGGSAKEAEARLAKHIYNEFSKVPAGALVWRRKPVFESQEIVVFGDTYLTQTHVEDLSVEEKLVYLDESGKLILPAGVEHDWTTGDYRYVTNRFMLHRMSMRLVLPESYKDKENLPIQAIARKEGETSPRI